MYIAFKYLFFLNFAMWIAMCCFDLYLKTTKDSFRACATTYKDIAFKNNTLDENDKNKLNEINTSSYLTTDIASNRSFLYSFMLCIGSCILILKNRKKRMSSDSIDSLLTVSYAQVLLSLLKSNMYNVTGEQITLGYFQHFLIRSRFQVLLFLVNIKLKIYDFLKENLAVFKMLFNRPREDKQVCQTICIYRKEKSQSKSGSKRINSLYIPKHRSFNIDDSRKTHKCKCATFLHLYLASDQENKILKIWFSTVVREKNEIENRLTNLVHQIYLMGCPKLKVFCEQCILPSSSHLQCKILSDSIRYKNDLKSTCIHKSTSTEITFSQSPLEDVIKTMSQVVGGLGDSPLTPLSTSFNYGTEQLCSYSTEISFNASVKSNCNHRYRNQPMNNFCEAEINSEVQFMANITKYSHCITNHKFLTNSEAFKTFLRKNKSVAVAYLPKPVFDSNIAVL